MTVTLLFQDNNIVIIENVISIDSCNKKFLITTGTGISLYYKSVVKSILVKL